ncbi:MAG: hypothetical protein OSJ83_03585 [Clostridia bacterium]|nr:hypothetical protein [Clostridia bacterium]
MYETVAQRANARRKVLFHSSDECFARLTACIEKQSHKTLIMWAFELAEESVQDLIKKYPHDNRPTNALNLSKLWASGEVKMPVAKKAILDCHAMAKEITDISDIALCHAIGQACSVVHTRTHAPGYPIYELTAIVRRIGMNEFREAVEQRINFYIDRLLFWQKQSEKTDLKWANFIDR